MYESSHPPRNYDPNVITSAITTGNIGRLADSTAELRARLAKQQADNEANLARLTATLADIRARIGELEKQRADEAITKAARQAIR